jgi:hypothetical protein
MKRFVMEIPDELHQRLKIHFCFGREDNEAGGFQTCCGLRREGRKEAEKIIGRRQTRQRLAADDAP